MEVCFAVRCCCLWGSLRVLARRSGPRLRAPPPIGVGCRVSPGVTRVTTGQGVVTLYSSVLVRGLEVYRAAQSGEAAEFASPGPAAAGRRHRVRKIKFLVLRDELLA